MDSIGELTLIGDDDVDSKLDFASAVPGEVRVLHQSLSVEGDESWQRAAAAGFADVSVIIGRNAAICHVVFTLQSDDMNGTLVAHGVLPTDRSTGIGDGVLAVTGGTGDFDSVGGSITVEAVNPKKYHIITRSPL